MFGEHNSMLGNSTPIFSLIVTIFILTKLLILVFLNLYCYTHGSWTGLHFSYLSVIQPIRDFYKRKKNTKIVKIIENIGACKNFRVVVYKAAYGFYMMRRQSRQDKETVWLLGHKAEQSIGWMEPEYCHPSDIIGTKSIISITRILTLDSTLLPKMYKRINNTKLIFFFFVYQHLQFRDNLSLLKKFRPSSRMCHW